VIPYRSPDWALSIKIIKSKQFFAIREGDWLVPLKASHQQNVAPAESENYFGLVATHVLHVRSNN
jgi:hypothetical protein